MRNFLYLVLVIMLTSCSGVSDKGSAANEESKFVDVDLCDVLNRPSEFDGREIRIYAIWIGTFEGSFGYDPRCVSEDRLVWFEVGTESVGRQIEPYFVPETEEFRTKGLNRMKGRFVGIFETKKREGFGHLNSANHNLTITSATDLRAVEPSEPYPW